jgi:hypothetical protein
MSMKARFRLYQRGGGVFYSFDNETKAQKSLGTQNEHEAKRLLAQLNEAQIQPAINRQIARGYLMASDPQFNDRTWRYVLDMVTQQKQGATKERWLKVGSDKRAIGSPRNYEIPKTLKYALRLSIGSVSADIRCSVTVFALLNGT